MNEGDNNYGHYDGNLTRIDGGSGIDTLSLNEIGRTLDLTQIANQAGGNPSGGSRLSSIEIINLTGGPPNPGNTLKLSASDVFDMSEANVFQSTGAQAGRHQLLVMGDSSDYVDFHVNSQSTIWGWGNGNGTGYGSPFTYEGHQFNVWNGAGLTTVYIQTSIPAEHVLGID